MKYISLIALLSILLTSCNTKTMNNGLIIKDSPYNVETTYNNIKTIISNNPNLKVLLELDHSKNALNADLELNDTKIILFGNPKLGTPLMQVNQTIGIDLPQKIIIYSDNKTNSKIAYNDPLYLKKRHLIEGKDTIFETISNALNMITNKATAK